MQISLLLVSAEYANEFIIIIYYIYKENPYTSIRYSNGLYN